MGSLRQRIAPIDKELQFIAIELHTKPCDNSAPADITALPARARQTNSIRNFDAFWIRLI